MSQQEAPRPIRQGLWALARFLRPYRWSVGGLIVSGMVISFLETVGISLLIPVLEGLSQQSAAKVMTGHFLMGALSAPFAPISPAQRLQVVVATMLGLILLKNLAGYIIAVWTERMVVRVERDLRLRVLDRFMTGTSYRVIARYSVGQLLTRLQSEPERTCLAIQGLIHMLSTLCLIIAYGVLLLLISWPLTLLAVVFLLGLSWILRWPVRYANAIGERKTHAIAEVSQAGVEALEGIRVVRAFGREAFEQDRYGDRLHRLNLLQLRGAGLSYLPLPLAESLSMAVLAVFLVMGAPSLVVQGGQMLPLLLTFLFVLYRLLPRVAYFHATWVTTALSLAGASAVARTLDPQGEPSAPVSGRRPFHQLCSSIRLEHVTFTYQVEEGAVVKDLCLEIPAGRTTALVGVSGVGKSTLVDLLLRFYDPDGGRITVDGVDLRELNLTQWRAAIGVANQETFVFRATVQENIAYGTPDATEEEIREAARRAHAHEFIMAMARGYDTVVGDRGARLSAGQRQRLAIARAILRNPQLLILDEATSALDSASERHVQEALAELRGQRTVLVIAHRLSTVADADHIVVLQDGRVVERGTHAGLIAHGGAYATLWSLQSLPRQPMEDPVSVSPVES